jgi:hypothetical protein
MQHHLLYLNPPNLGNQIVPAADRKSGLVVAAVGDRRTRLAERRYNHIHQLAFITSS